jgi:hypothetical protein
VRRFRSELHESVQFIQDPKLLRDSISKLYRKQVGEGRTRMLPYAPLRSLMLPHAPPSHALSRTLPHATHLRSNNQIAACVLMLKCVFVCRPRSRCALASLTWRYSLSTTDSASTLRRVWTS